MEREKMEGREGGRDFGKGWEEGTKKHGVAHRIVTTACPRSSNPDRAPATHLVVVTFHAQVEQSVQACQAGRLRERRGRHLR